MKKIHLDTCNISFKERWAVNKALRNSEVSSYGKNTQAFIEQIKGLTGAKSVVLVNSCTTALYLSLLDSGIGRGDEVIIPALTFGATANAVAQTGARPVIIDSDIDTWCMDVEKIEEAITPRTRAIIPVHLYGNMCDMDEIVKIAHKYNLTIIEDASEALGSFYENKHAGTIGHYGCLSFNGNKLITTGHGGAIISNSVSLVDIQHKISQSQTITRNYTGQGYNYRLAEINCALGVAQMKRIDKFIEKKKQINEIYKELLPFTFQHRELRSTFMPWYSACLIPHVDIDELITNLAAQGIPARRVFRPLHRTTAYRRRNRLPNAQQIYKQGICLPVSTLNSVGQTVKVCSTLYMEVIND